MNLGIRKYGSDRVLVVRSRGAIRSSRREIDGRSCAKMRVDPSNSRFAVFVAIHKFRDTETR